MEISTLKLGTLSGFENNKVSDSAEITSFELVPGMCQKKVLLKTKRNHIWGSWTLVYKTIYVLSAQTRTHTNVQTFQAHPSSPC